ncbi:hypothetical protein [Thiomonas sp.]
MKVMFMSRAVHRNADGKPVPVLVRQDLALTPEQQEELRAMAPANDPEASHESSR